MAQIKHLTTLFRVTLWSAAPSFIVYELSRLTNTISDATTWHRLDPETGFMFPNHGPWYDTWQGIIVFVGFLFLFVLFLFSVAYSIYGIICLISNRSKMGQFLLHSLALIVTQMIITIEQVHNLAWTID